MENNNETYNGHKNYKTWNVSLWIGNDQGYYEIAQSCESYKHFTDALISIGETYTPDEVAWSDSELDFEALNELILNIKEGC